MLSKKNIQAYLDDWKIMATRMTTWQDFLASQARSGTEKFLLSAISTHKASELYTTALKADKYDKQRNTTINEYVKTIFTLTGAPVADYTASNSKIASNFFNRLNVQRLSYSLGAGVSFTEENTKDQLGQSFDNDLRKWAYAALIHGVAFGYWSGSKLYTFEITEFVPFWDELTGALMGGIRFWQIDSTRPMSITLYTPDGYSEYVYAKKAGSRGKKLVQTKEQTAYLLTVSRYPDGTSEIVGEDNWDGELPIVPMWGSRLHQSTLIGMQQAIDSYDLIQSGFANDLTDVSQIYWIVENCGGMSDADLARFRDRLKVLHIAPADTDQGGKVTPYQQEVPYQARQAYLEGIERRIYRDFGGLDVTALSATSKTATEIEAAYQPVDENASDFEFQIAGALQRLLSLIGIEDTPIFKRQRVSNQLEQVQMIATEAQWLDRKTILAKLPNLTADEAQTILDTVDAGDAARIDALEQEE